MIEGSDCLAVSDAFLLSNDDNQNIILHTTTEQITYETKTTETINAADIIPRPRSLTLIEKFRRIALYSFPSSRRRAARHSCDNILQPQINSASIIDGEVKLKGILKNSTDTLSSLARVRKPFSIRRTLRRSESCLGQYDEANNKENSNGLISLNNSCDILRSGSNSSISDKHVTFSDEIIKREYLPSESVSDVTQLPSSPRQQRKLKKFERNGSLNLYSLKAMEDFKRNHPSELLKMERHALETFVM